jgi:hypothetical protein
MHGDVEVGQLDAGMEALLKAFNQARSNVGLEVPREYRQNDGDGKQDEEKASGQP